ncbi:MAG: alpha/beta hydrolase [Cyanobacteria bacterium J06641_5]
MTTQVLCKAPPDALWLTVSPGFQWLSERFLNCLAKRCKIARWAYSQTPDEPGSLDVAVTLLHDYIKGLDRPIHLLGHGTAGLLGLMFAQQFPTRVRSLSLLSVGVNPAMDWQAHYYTLLETLPCSRERVLAQMARTLFGPQPRSAMRDWIGLLEQDLLHSPSPHSLLGRVNLCPGSAAAPLLVCGGSNDAILDDSQFQGWESWLKDGDRLWQCPSGRHFFHGDYPYTVANRILDFWALNEQPAALATASAEPAN